MSAQSEASDQHAASGAEQPSGQLPAGYLVGGKYVIKRVLGEGANGSVYEGEHTQIGHRVAIKVVHKALATSEDIVQRFAREARICATIRNRNVGQVYDVGELPNGAPYMVMELHEGRSLAKMLVETGPLPFAVALDIAQQLLIGLQAAHESAVVHRDVKPDNIMIVRESSGHMLVKLVDFGIGKSLDADISARSVTQEGALIGSPDYMSPEALRGEEVDLRADIYAAGVVLYEMVTGRVPFDADSITELFVAILRDAVVPPRKLRPDCPVALERVIEKAMCRDSSRRYRAASEMREALERVRRECGYSSDVLTRFSVQPHDGVRGAPVANTQLAGGRAPERVLTTELKLPVKRTGMRVLLAGVVLALGGVAALVLWPAPPARLVPAGSPPTAAAPENAAPVSGEPPTAAALANGAAVPGEPSTAAAPENAEAASREPSPTAVAANAAAAPGEEPTGAAPENAAPAPGAPPPTAAAAANGAPVAAEPQPAAAAPVPKRGKARDRRGRKAEAAATPARSKASATPARTEAAPVANPTEQLQQAAAAFVRGQMPRARALYREATELAPASPEAWRGLGMVSSRMGERSEAARALQRYLTLRPNAPDAAAIRKKLQEL